MINPRQIIADIALGEIGNHEDPIGSNTGSSIRKYFEADDLTINGKTDGYPWCCSFVCWVLREAAKKNPALKTRTPLRTAAVRLVPGWAEQNGCTVFGPNDKYRLPQAGDIVSFLPDLSHIAIVVGYSQAQKLVLTVEGNTTRKPLDREGWYVKDKTPKLSQCGTFFRIPVRPTQADFSGYPRPD